MATFWQSCMTLLTSVSMCCLSRLLRQLWVPDPACQNGPHQRMLQKQSGLQRICHPSQLWTASAVEKWSCVCALMPSKHRGFRDITSIKSSWPILKAQTCHIQLLHRLRSNTAANAVTSAHVQLKGVLQPVTVCAYLGGLLHALKLNEDAHCLVIRKTRSCHLKNHDRLHLPIFATFICYFILQVLIHLPGSHHVSQQHNSCRRACNDATLQSSPLSPCHTAFKAATSTLLLIPFSPSPPPIC